MENNVLTKMLLRSVMPTVQKFVESGKIDAIFKELKSQYSVFVDDPDSSVEILITTESDGVEYVNVVALTKDLRVTKLLYQQQLSGLITDLFTKADM